MSIFFLEKLAQIYICYSQLYASTSIIDRITLHCNHEMLQCWSWIFNFDIPEDD